jgi:demethylmenaquinone methyltransferase/2-methoxy-6-polyprenyl-1,4-benzoquinol methylase
MNTEHIAGSRIGSLVIRLLGAGMESAFRYRFFGPVNILRGAGLLPGQAVLEVGCGTGYFTVPAARLIGNEGRMVAIDILQQSVDLVECKVQAAGLTNVRVLKADAQETGLDAGSFDTVLLFGVIPSPMLPLPRLLPELHRLLKQAGILAVWPPVPGWLPGSILRCGLFRDAGGRNGVHSFRRC